jgi:hypothetical protein
MKIIERTFSGYRLNLPKDFRLFVRTRDGVLHQVEFERVSYYMRLRARDILKDYE